MTALYDITKTFEENMTYGPFWDGEFPSFSNTNPNYSFLGKKVNSLFGASASPLTHGSRGVRLCSRLGYDIITYRSVRSIEWYGQKFPHWLYVSVPQQLTEEGLQSPVVGSMEPFANQEVSTANSFGIQSFKPEYWQADFEVAKKSLTSGQLLILALMFTPETGKNVLDDAEVVANYAKETSAEVFEINLAHPNSGMKSLVYEDVATSVAICKRVKKALGGRPLIAKVGYYKNKESVNDFLLQTKGILSGVSSTNTYAMPITNKDGGEIFPGRVKAGVSGAAVRTLSMEQAKAIVSSKKALGLTDLAIIGIGGVTEPKHIDAYLQLGVDAVQSAAGIFANPLLASQYKNKK